MGKSWQFLSDRAASLTVSIISSTLSLPLPLPLSGSSEGERDLVWRVGTLQVPIVLSPGATSTSWRYCFQAPQQALAVRLGSEQVDHHHLHLHFHVHVHVHLHLHLHVHRRLKSGGAKATLTVRAGRKFRCAAALAFLAANADNLHARSLALSVATRSTLVVRAAAFVAALTGANQFGEQLLLRARTRCQLVEFKFARNFRQAPFAAAAKDALDVLLISLCFVSCK